MNSYIVLRDMNADRRRRATGGMVRPPMPGFGPMVRGTAGLESVPPEPDVRLESLGAGDLRDLVRDPTVVEIARNMPTRLIAPIAAEPAATGQPTWGVEAVGALTSPFDGAGVKVAVLDTGIDADHPAFTGVTLTQRDFSGDGDGDGNGHGTHCAGTIFGREVEGTRIGVATGVTEAMIGKVLGNDGSGSSEMLFEAMQWAATAQARVISMSLGFDFPGLGKRLVDDGVPADLATSIALEAYRMNLRVFDSLLDMFRVQAAFTGGTVVVAASGNESRRDEDPDLEVSASVPAAALGVISVGALAEGDSGLTVAPFSNTNPVLSAPGVGVISANAGGGLQTLNGTSMACPHVAGVTALWWQAVAAAGVPLTPDAVTGRLRANADATVFAPGTDIADRGEGLAKAPSAAMS